MSKHCPLPDVVTVFLKTSRIEGEGVQVGGGFDCIEIENERRFSPPQAARLAFDVETETDPPTVRIDDQPFPIRGYKPRWSWCWDAVGMDTATARALVEWLLGAGWQERGETL